MPLGVLGLETADKHEQGKAAISTVVLCQLGKAWKVINGLYLKMLRLENG